MNAWQTRAIAAGILGVLALLIGAWSAVQGAPATAVMVLVGLVFVLIGVACLLAGRKATPGT